MKNKIKALEEELLSFEVRSSRKRLEELLSDNFYELAQDGKKYNKEEIINILIELKEKFNSKIEGFYLNEISEKTFLVSYTLYREFTETLEKRKTLCSSIWKEKNDKLEMIFFQGTKGN